MKDISELHIRKEIKVEGNGKVHLTIESFNSLHRKEYTLSPAMWQLRKYYRTRRPSREVCT